MNETDNIKQTIECFKRMKEGIYPFYPDEYLDIAINVLEEYIPWIPIKIRPLTEEEREMYGDEYEFMYDCKIPNDGQDVLVTLENGEVSTDTFYNDDNAYFERYCDEGEVIAWRSFPKPYKMPRAAEPGKSKENRKCDNCAYYQWAERTNKCNQCQDYSHWIEKPGAAEPEEN